MVFKRLSIFVAAAACGLGSVAMAGGTAPSAEVAAMRAELAQVKAQLGELRTQESEAWLTERRAEEVKGLIHEVLSDASTRASFADGGALAGVDKKGKIFLKSADGKYKLNIAGQFQFRYLFVINDSAADEIDEGFQVRRAKVKFGGQIGDPKFKYAINLTHSSTSGATSLEDAYASYSFDNGWTVKFGLFKLPFLRQELTSSSRQVAVDRAVVTEFFTLDRSEQVQLGYKGDAVRFAVSLSDGADEEESQIGADSVEVAITARGDFLIAGDWGQAKDNFAWVEKDTAIFVGVAAHYQAGDGNNGANSAPGNADYLGWTIDGSIETGGLAIFAAFMGGHIFDDGSAVGADLDFYGLLLQAAYNVTDELAPFIRWNWIDPDSAGGGDIGVITAGVNFFFRKHASKLTVDVVWVYDNEPNGNAFGNGAFGTGLGFTGVSTTSGNDTILARAQYQLTF